MIDFPLVFIGFWRASPSKMMVLPMVFERKSLIFHWFLLVFWRAPPSKRMVWPTVFDGKSLFFVGFCWFSIHFLRFLFFFIFEGTGIFERKNVYFVRANGDESSPRPTHSK